MGNTKISINEGTNVSDRFLLNIAELEDNVEYTKLAYCSNVEGGTTIEDKAFFKFTLFDKGGHKIIGRIFNIENIEDKGIIANNLKSSVVKIRFALNKFSGTNTLRILSIDPVPSSVCSREEFIGAFSDTKEDLTAIMNYVDRVVAKYSIVGQLFTKNDLAKGIEHVSMPDMWAGRRGSAIKFSAMFLSMCDSSMKSDKAIAIALLCEVFMYWKYAQDMYYEQNVLSLGDNVNKVLAKSDKYIDAVMEAAKKTNSKEEQNICTEVKHLLKCYFGYIEPETYISMSLVALRKTLINIIELCDENESMLSGTYKNIISCDGTTHRMIRL